MKNQNDSPEPSVILSKPNDPLLQQQFRNIQKCAFNEIST